MHQEESQLCISSSVVVVEVVVVPLLGARHVDPSTPLESTWTLCLCVTSKDKEGGEEIAGLKVWGQAGGKRRVMGNVNKTPKKNSKRKKVRMRLIDLRLEGLFISVCSSVKWCFVDVCCLERVFFPILTNNKQQTSTTAQNSCHVAALS